MEYSTCSYCCKQIANNDFDTENGRCCTCQERWRLQRERRLEKDRLRYRRDREDPEKMEAIRARRQIEEYCKARRCYTRKCCWGKQRKTVKHVKNGGPEMEEERKMKEEEEKMKLEEAEEQIMIEKLKQIFKHVKMGRMV